MKKQYLEAAKILRSRGLKGELVLENWCDNPEILCNFTCFYSKDGNIKYQVLHSFIHKGQVIIALDGIDSIEKAEKMRNTILYVDRNEIKLPKDRHFIQDLIGISVYDYNTNKFYGEISSVFNSGANDIYEIKNEKNESFLIPVIKDIVRELDIEKKTLKITPLEGIFS